MDILYERWPVVSAALAAFAFAIYFPIFMQGVQLWNIPLVGANLGGSEKRRQAFLSSARSLYLEGYQKFKDGVFALTTTNTSTTLVVSPKFLPELRQLPDTILSMEHALTESLEVKFTKFKTLVPIIPHTIKSDLTPSLGRINTTLDEEIREGIALDLPSCADWTDVNINEALLRIIARGSGRIFVGPELCRTEEYLDAAINYTKDLSMAQFAVQYFRPWLRPIIGPWLPHVRTLDDRIKKTRALMEPAIQSRKDAASEPDYQKPDDLMQWFLDAQSKFPDENSQDLPDVQMSITFAATHTTTITATNVLFDLAALPDFVSELREEIREALSNNDNMFTNNALQAMKKMDSLFRESMRVRPVALAAFNRKVLQPFTLSNGQEIPKDVLIEIPSIGINTDPDVFPNPMKYDPLRFYRLRSQAKGMKATEEAALNQFVSVSEKGLTFGYGRHACPGRFFAAAELKMVIARIIMKYDIALAGGETERYQNIDFSHMSIPDVSKPLRLKAIA